MCVAWSSRLLRRTCGHRQTLTGKGKPWVARRGSNGPEPLTSPTYTQRNTVERAINKLKQFRAVATRYDKCASLRPVR